MKRFCEKLKQAMQELNLNQVQVVGMTGCSKASVSQYLSGKNIPTEEKQRDIAVCIGLEPTYFEQERVEAVPFTKKNDGCCINRLSVDDAAKLMGVNHHTIRAGLQQGVFPWGYAVKTSENRWVYIINGDRFAQIELSGQGNHKAESID